MAIVNLPAIIPSLSDLAASVPIGISQLGTPIYDNIFFPPGTYINSLGISVPYVGLSLDSFKITVSGEKKIIRTPISGRSGDVKEYVNQMDYNISIDGKVTELFNVFPADQLNNWRRIWESPEPVLVISRFLNEIWGITNIVIIRFSVSPVVGSRNESDIRIQAVQDQGFDVKDFLFQNK